MAALCLLSACGPWRAGQRAALEHESCGRLRIVADSMIEHTGVRHVRFDLDSRVLTFEGKRGERLTFANIDAFFCFRE